MQKHAKMRHSSKLISSDFSNLPPKEGQKKKRTVKLWNCEDFSRSQGRQLASYGLSWQVHLYNGEVSPAADETQDSSVS
jgi:hypothetical protein